MFLQECTTAEEYKELLTLMEERLRVMRQVSRSDFFVCIFIFITAFVFIFDGGTSPSDVPGLYVMECTEGKVGDTMSPFSLQLPHSAIPLQQHCSVLLQICFLSGCKYFQKDCQPHPERAD